MEPAMIAGTDRSLMTTLGIIEGEILSYLEAYGATPLRRLVRDLEWPSPLVMMAVGALVRERLARAVRHDLEVIIEPMPPIRPRGASCDEPEVWGG